MRMVRGYVVAGILSPFNFGVIQSLAIFQMYLPVIQGGYNQSVEREIPYLEKKGDRNQISKIYSNGVIWSLICGVIASLVYIFVFLLQTRASNEIIIWAGYLPVILLFPLSNFLELVFVASGRIRMLSAIRVVTSLLFVGSIVFVFYFDFIGQVLTLSLQFVVLCVLLFFRYKQQIQLQFVHFTFIWKHVKNGVGIIVSQYLFFVLLSMDRIYMAGFIGATEYAQYALALSFFRFALLIPENINVISYRYLNLSKSSSIQTSKTDFVYLLQFTFFLLLGVSLFIFAFSPVFYTYILPKYIGAINYTQIMSAAVVFSGISFLVIHYLYAEFQQKTAVWVFLTTMLALSIALALGYVFKQTGLYVAFCFLGSQVLLSTLLLFVFFRSSSIVSKRLFYRFWGVNFVLLLAYGIVIFGMLHTSSFIIELVLLCGFLVLLYFASKPVIQLLKN